MQCCERKGSSELEAKHEMAEPVPDNTDTQQSANEDESTAAEDFRSILAALPPVQEWSDVTIEDLKSAVKNKHAEAKWQEESPWTRRAIDAILAPNEDWDWQKLKICSNAEYFSLPIHTISLLNALFHSHEIDKASVCIEAGDFAAYMDLRPARGGNVGYPIFRVDYTSDECFELYKKCWDRVLEKEYYIPEAVFPESVTWHWVDKKHVLDGKGPRDIRKLYKTLCGRAFPAELDRLWLCIMVDREAIESMLRVYGPPGIKISGNYGRATSGLNGLIRSESSSRSEVPAMPYITALSVQWRDLKISKKRNHAEAIGEGDGAPRTASREYNGQFKVAMKYVFELWNNEQEIEPSRAYSSSEDGLIYDLYMGWPVYEPPRHIHGQQKKQAAREAEIGTER